MNLNLIQMQTASCLLLLLFALAACQPAETPGTDPAPEATPETTAEAGMPAEAAPVEARREGDAQVVEIEVTQIGYEPNRIRLQEGVPARLVFTRTAEGSCAERVQIPAYDIGPTNLPLEEPVALEFTPQETGTFQFVCGMDMLGGRLIVAS